MGNPSIHQKVNKTLKCCNINSERLLPECMKLIRRVEISRFRSIREAVLPEIGDFSVLAGVNNSGKSNFIRALSAFFTDQVEPGLGLQVDADYYRPEVRAKKKKSISVKVCFELPNEFRFRKGLQGVEALLGRSFALRKEWIRGEDEPKFFLNDRTEPLNANDRAKVAQFLSLLSFRYVPNRVLPLEVIKKEHQPLRDVLIRRLARIQREQKNIFDRVGETSMRLIGRLSDHIHAVFPDVTGLRLATPKSFAEMIFSFGYKLREAGFEFEDAIQGSGLQSYLMFQTLHLIDRDYFQRFGWRQAAIWVIEEPESSLHTSLEASTALFLKTIAIQPESRLQIVATTHSDLMIQYADPAFFVERSRKGSGVARCSPYEILEKSARAGVSRWVHPILHAPLEPLILVEGKHDEIFFSKAFSVLGVRDRVRVSYLEQMGAGRTSGGVDALSKYVREHKNAIKARTRRAPVLVVLDWDSESKQKQFEGQFSTTDPFKALVWPRDKCNPKLGTSFHGVERFFSDRLIEAAEDAGASIGRDRRGVALVDRSEYGRVKEILAKVVEEDLRKEDLVYSEEFLKEVLRTAGIKLQ